MKIYERVYDNPKNKDGSEKPNKLLGEFEIVEGKMDDYSYQVYARKDDGKLYKIIGKEVSGYYHPNEGGTKNTIIPLEESADVEIYLTTIRELRDELEKKNEELERNNYLK